MRVEEGNVRARSIRVGGSCCNHFMGVRLAGRTVAVRIGGAAPGTPAGWQIAETAPDRCGWDPPSAFGISRGRADPRLALDGFAVVPCIEPSTDGAPWVPFLPEGTVVRLVERGYEAGPIGFRDLRIRQSGWAQVLTLKKVFLEHGVRC